MNPELVENLLAQIEQRDLSTAAHTWRVVLYARALAERFGVSDELMHQITLGAALHDVGKLDTPIEILQKPGRLTTAEFEIIKLHTVAGYARLVQLDVQEEEILDLVRYHHERWGGLGYPFGLRGDEIPVGARFFAVIDAFDAMTSVRPYRTGVGPEAGERAIQELVDSRGTHYWPEAVDAFVELHRSGAIGWIMHYFNDTVPLPSFQSTEGLRAVKRGRSELRP